MQENILSMITLLDDKYYLCNDWHLTYIVSVSIFQPDYLDWSRRQQFEITGVFYYGYLVTLPLSGIFSDKLGGKVFFVHSLTAQAVVFMLIPVFARMNFYAGATIRVIQGLIAVRD